MIRKLSWYQVNYTEAGRSVRANVLTTYDDTVTVGKDLDLTIEGDVTDAVVLAAVRDLLTDQTVGPVEIVEPEDEPVQENGEGDE